jgi:hypothetical protein
MQEMRRGVHRYSARRGNASLLRSANGIEEVAFLRAYISQVVMGR